MRRRWTTRAVAIVALALGAVLATAAGAGAARDAGSIHSRFALANRCVAIAAQSGGFVVADGDGYRVARTAARRAESFYFKATRLGSYMLYDSDARLMRARRRAAVGRGTLDRADASAEWSPRRAAHGAFTLRPASSSGHSELAAARGSGRLVRMRARRAPGPRRLFSFVRSHDCRRFPEARAGASGHPFKGTRHGALFGFADAHLHITASMRAGGRVISGESFDRFGIARALGRDAGEHGADGHLDVTGNLLRDGLPTGTHDTHGWPTFTGWPVHDTFTHQQVYYVWLKRAWLAGERLVVAQTVEDAPLCRVEPRRSHSCDEPRAIALEVKRLRALQDYVDAQSGGSGRGWFRLVYSPREARRTIERGELAVVIGVESSDLLGCGERSGRSSCTRADVDRGVRELRRIGVRSAFVAHWVNNAFAGPALEGGIKGAFINVLNAFATGRYFSTERCPDPREGEEMFALSLPLLSVIEPFFPAIKPLLARGAPPSYPPGRQCDDRGLTPLGRHLIRRLIAAHMLIEVDHLSEKARRAVLRIAQRAHYPLVSSHTGTGGAWTPSQLRKLYALGGFATATPDDPRALASKILRLRRYRARGRFFGVGLGTDTGGFSALPGPPPDAATRPLRYPFTSYDGDVRFRRQRTGERTFDLNTDGVAHYGLFADLLADMGRSARGRRALALLFRSAEAYVRTWERAVAHWATSSLFSKG